MNSPLVIVLVGSANKFSELLLKLECFQEISVAVEMTSLEDAYLKIVKSETKVKDDEEN